MACGSEAVDGGHIDDPRQRRERLAAPFVVEPAQPAMALRIMIEVDADAALILGDGFAAARAERTVRTAAAARHRIESQRFPQKRLSPVITLSPSHRRANTIFVAGIDPHARKARHSGAGVCPGRTGTPDIHRKP